MEIHIHGPLFARRESPDTSPPEERRDDQPSESDDGSGGRPSALPAVVGLVALASLAYAIRRIRSGDSQTTLDEPTD